MFLLRYHEYGVWNEIPVGNCRFGAGRSYPALLICEIRVIRLLEALAMALYGRGTFGMGRVNATGAQGTLRKLKMPA